jgi:hypothetical protein
MECSFFIFQIIKKTAEVRYKVRVKDGSIKVKWTSKSDCDKVEITGCEREVFYSILAKKLY